MDLKVLWEDDVGPRWGCPRCGMPYVSDAIGEGCHKEIPVGHGWGHHAMGGGCHEWGCFDWEVL